MVLFKSAMFYKKVQVQVSRPGTLIDNNYYDLKLRHFKQDNCEILFYSITSPDGISWISGSKFLKSLLFKNPTNIIFNEFHKNNGLYIRWSDLLKTSFENKTVRVPEYWRLSCTMVHEKACFELIARSKLNHKQNFELWFIRLIEESRKSLMRTIFPQKFDHTGAVAAAAAAADKLPTLRKIPNLPEISGYFYIAVRPSFIGLDIYKIGKTTNLDQRIYEYNCGVINDFMEYKFVSSPTIHFHDIETDMKINLMSARIGSSRELVKIKIENLIAIFQCVAKKYPW